MKSKLESVSRYGFSRDTVTVGTELCIKGDQQAMELRGETSGKWGREKREKGREMEDRRMGVNEGSRRNWWPFIANEAV